LALAVLVLTACTRPGAPADLLRLEPAEVNVNGRGADWFASQRGKPLRLMDSVRRVLPASPPSRLRYDLDLPKEARLSFACGIPIDRHDRTGVEFVVKVRQGEREETVFSEVLDPLQRPGHRRWMPFDVDLGKYHGRVQLSLETRGFENDPEDSRRAFWGAPTVTSARIPAPLVIVYLVDTLRADHTSPYGYTRDTTPNLTSFAHDSVLFESAIAQASWTKPSVASLMTSLLPGQHHAVQLRDPLASEQLTLAEMLQAKGYTTAAAIANSVIYSQGSNFEQGFDVFSGLHGPAGKPSKLVEAAVVVDEALRQLDARRGLPTFLYVHTMDPHVPYAPPPPFDRKYEPFPTPEHPAVDPHTDFKEPLDRERLMAQYDGDVAYGDQEFGRFVGELRRRGVYDGALFVFLADHGEEFQDHDKWLHGRSVFDELIRVPLIVKLPGNERAGLRVKAQVQVVDVLPTVLKSQGLPVPEAPAIVGRPLQMAIAGTESERPALSEISHRGFVAHGLRTNRDKYVVRYSPEEDELYFDLGRDPHEHTNRLAEAGERVRSMRAGVEAVMTPNPYRHVLRFAGSGRWEIELRTRGWLQDLESSGLGAAEAAQLLDGGRRLLLKMAPRPDRSREVSFTIRPLGAPARLSGTRDGRLLRTTDVFLSEQAVAPLEVPFKLPDLESEAERTENMLAPPAATVSGLYVWLKPLPGRTLLQFDSEARERLKALGYLN
jgi:arylsulfatase A-like enzyme